MAMNDSEGRRIPFNVDDCETQSISGVDFSPAEDASLTEAQRSKYLNGFYVAPNADDYLYVVSWRQYHANGDSVNGLSPQKIYSKEKDFFPMRVVKVFANDTSGYTTTVTEVQIGFLD